MLSGQFLESAHMFTELVVEHYWNSVPDGVWVPIPPKLNKYIAAILILRNPQFPRHFLNGYYVVLHEDAKRPLRTGSSLTAEEIILILSRNIPRNWSTTPFIHRQLPLTLSWRFLGWNTPPTLGTIPTEWTREKSLVLSSRPGILDRIFAGLRCYRTELLNRSCITDGSQYFSTKYPAKRALVEHETTLAWVDCESTRAVGFIQYFSHSNDQGEIHTLITGLSVEEDWRRRGFASALIDAVVFRVPSHEIWVGVMEDNMAASSLYRKYGFAERGKQWGLLSKTMIS